ncbi:MAG TPA: TetR/AcrR family transcriptional regulator [Solirubrobacterales bacterium]|nr:TetR/AcrR family transcriptional regulator [Solirubrobacterales bacterium]
MEAVAAEPCPPGTGDRSEDGDRKFAPVALPPRPDPDPLLDPLSLAVVAEVSECGYAAASLAGVLRRAGVTAAEFELRFDDLDDCALDTLERLIAAFERRVARVFNRGPDWRSALRAAAYESADWLEENPGTAPFAMTEALRMGNEIARVRREGLFEFCAALIESGREAAPDPGSIPAGASIHAAGSILNLLTHRLLEGASVSYHQGARESLYGVMRIYLGPEVAGEELRRPLPARAPRVPAGPLAAGCR